MTLPPRALSALLAVAARLDRAGVEWLLAGSAARALMGVDVRPADIDIEVSPHSAAAVQRSLGITLAYAAGGGRSSWRGATAAAGVEVDVTCDLDVEGPGGRLAPDFPLLRTWSPSREVAGRRIWLVPIEESLARAIVRADWAALARIAGEAARGAAPAPRPAYLSLRLSRAAASAAR
ncbi:MAG: hypothetical protein AB7V42_05580 [Thermoleophilia bacterium]